MERISPKTEFTNMVMIENTKRGEVLVQNRAISWCGYAFPGGHVECGESFYGSAVREIKEETGLDIKNLELCGIVHWSQKQSGQRYIVYMYKTSDFSGKLKSKTEEGANMWVQKQQLRQLSLSPNMEKYLDIFLGGRFREFFGVHDGDKKDITIFEC